MGLVCFLSGGAAAETILYFEDFSGANADVGMEPGNPVGWRAGPPAGSGSTAEPWFIREADGGHYLEFAGANEFDGNGRAYATRPVTGLSSAVGNGWRVSTEFTIDEARLGQGDAHVFRFGVGGAGARTLYMSSSLGGAGGNEFYLGDIGFTGGGDLAGIAPSLRIYRFGGGASGASGQIVSQTLSAGYLNTTDTFRLTLEGFREENGLRLAARIENLSDEAATGMVIGFDANPHLGHIFGYRHNSAPATSPNRLERLTLRHDNFVVAAVTAPLLSIGTTLLYGQDFSQAAVDQGMEAANPAGWRAGPPGGSSSMDEPWFIRRDGAGHHYLEFAGANKFDGNGRAYASVKVPSVLTVPGSGWRVSSDFTLEALAFGAGDNNLRFGVAGAGTRLLYLSASLGGAGGNEFYLGDFGFTAGVNTEGETLAQATPTLRIYRFGGGESGAGREVALSPPLPQGYLNQTDTYRLTLDGFYEEESIRLTARMENLTGLGKTVTISGIDSNPHRGSYFGYRHNSSPWFDVNQLAELRLRHDNFEVYATDGPLPDERIGREELASLIQYSVEIVDNRLTLSAAKPSQAQGFGWGVEVSEDLVHWGPGETMIDTEGEFIGRDVLAASAGERRFLRLRLIRE